jgi:hypothetical protein
MESTKDGKTWPRRFSSYEAQHSRHAAVRDGWLKLLQDFGYSPRFVSTEQIESGELVKGGFRVLVMPENWAVGEEELNAIGAWKKQSEAADWCWIVNNPLGVFDAHGKMASAFGKLGGQGVYWDSRELRKKNGMDGPCDHSGLPYDMAQYSIQRSGGAAGKEHLGDLLEGLRKALHWASQQVLTPTDLGIRTHRFRLGPARLLAFERNVEYHMSEDLKQAGGNELLEKPVEFEARLSAKAHLYDLRGKAYLGETDRIQVELQPWKPSLYALLPQKLPEGTDVVEALGGWAEHESP